MADKQIDCVVLKVFDEKVGQRGTMRIRAVRWIVNGKDTGPLFEKREFYDKNGREQMGKAKGFNPAEIRMIVERHIEIEEAMEQQPKEVADKMAAQKTVAAAAENSADNTEY